MSDGQLDVRKPPGLTHGQAAVQPALASDRSTVRVGGGELGELGELGVVDAKPNRGFQDLRRPPHFGIRGEPQNPD
jgi:hypothetical protein